MNKNDQEFLVEKIRTQYTEKEISGLDELRALDKKVKRPARVFAYVFGTIGAIVMGSGMSLVMTELPKMLNMENSMLIGIIIGIIGLSAVIINYPIYKHVLGKRRKKYQDKIIALSDKIINK